MGKLIIKKAVEDKSDIPEGFTKIFLAGAIDMGQADDWQTEITEKLKKLDSNIAVLNPRRDDWDSSWKQDISDKNFSEQVNWELDSMEEADIILLVFTKESKAPISLLELGIHCDSDKLFVCCPDGFYRKGNVQIVCERHNIPLCDSYDDLIQFIDES